MVLVSEPCSISWRDVCWVFDFSFCSLGSTLRDPELVGLKWGSATVLLLKFLRRSWYTISAENLCAINNRTWSNRNLVLPEEHDFPSQKRAISSPSSPQTPVCEGQFGYSLLFVATYCPFMLMVPQLNFEPLVTRFHHVLQLFVESSTDPQVSLFIFHNSAFYHHSL